MDIEQYFTDINIYSSAPGTSTAQSGSPTKNSAYQPNEGRQKAIDKQLTGLYQQLKLSFGKDGLQQADTEHLDIIDKYMYSSRVIRFPKIYQNGKELHVNAKRKRSTSNLSHTQNDAAILSKEYVFVMDRSPAGKYTVETARTNPVIQFNLKGRSQSMSKVIVVDKKLKTPTDYIALSKELRARLKDSPIKDVDEFQKKFSVPAGKILFEDTIDVCGPRLHARKMSYQSDQQYLPQIIPHAINPRVTRHGFSSDSNAIQNEPVIFQPLGGQSIMVLPSPPKKYLSLRPLPKRYLSAPKRQKIPRKSSIKDIKIEYEPILQADFLKIVQNYNYLQVGENRYGFYRAYIGQGNNSLLIKKTLKNRGFWLISDTLDENINFVWTQIRSNKFMEKLPQRLLYRSYFEKLYLKKKPYSQLAVDYHKEKGKEVLYLETAECILSKNKILRFTYSIVNYFMKHPRQPINGARLVEFANNYSLQRYKPTIIENPHNSRLHNHVNSASSLGNKKGLLFFMKRYYEMIGENPFEHIPQTVHLKDSTISEQSLRYFVPFDLPCILKPGESTNRGRGITVHTTWQSLLQAIGKNTKHENGYYRTHIIQQYLMPFLYNNRKFDIRIWVLWNGRQAWWYKEGYIRTSCKYFSLKNSSKYVHLTNDAIQKYSEDYGKYEPGNKVSFNYFQRYLDVHGGKHNFWYTAYPEMRKIAQDVFRVGNFTMDIENTTFGYELFGLDFMIDENFKVWLIEANTNPCLETGCSLLTRLITNMIDNVISLAVDPLFPPPSSWRKRTNNWSMETFKFELIYDGHTEMEDLKLEQVKFYTEEYYFVYEEKQTEKTEKC